MCFASEYGTRRRIQRRGPRTSKEGEDDDSDEFMSDKFIGGECVLDHGSSLMIFGFKGIKQGESMNGVQFVFKAFVTGIVVVGVSELAKKSSLLGAVLASLPLTSIAAFIWLYHDTHDLDALQKLSTGIFWLVIPSLAFFLIFPALIRGGFQFYSAMLISAIMTFGVYSAFGWGLSFIGIKL